MSSPPPPTHPPPPPPPPPQRADGEMERGDDNKNTEISDLEENIKDLKARIEYLEKYVEEIKVEMAFYKDMAEDCKGIFEKHRSTGRVPEEKRKMKREEPKVDFSASSRTWAPAARDDIFDRKRWNV